MKTTYAKNWDCPRRGDTTMAVLAMQGKPLSPEEYAHYCDTMLDPNGNPPGVDEWRMRGGEPVCSYCGSLHPDRFMERVEAGESVCPTDKAYKAYIGEDHHKFYLCHLSREQAQRFRDLYADGKVRVAYPGYFYSGLILHPAKPVADVDDNKTDYTEE